MGTKVLGKSNHGRLSFSWSPTPFLKAGACGDVMTQESIFSSVEEKLVIWTKYHIEIGN